MDQVHVSSGCLCGCCPLPFKGGLDPPPRPLTADLPLVPSQMPHFPAPRVDAAESSDEVVLLVEPPCMAPRRLSLPGQLATVVGADLPPDLHRHCSDPGS